MIEQRIKESDNIERNYFDYYPANVYLFKVNNRNTRNRCEICSKLIIKTPERRHDFEHVYVS